MASNYFDFQNAEKQVSAISIIPKGEIVPVRMTIRPGGHDDQQNGWVGGYATKSIHTGAVYLSTEFVVTGGKYFKRKMWGNIGLFSEKGPAWGNMGRSFIRAILNSSRGVHPKDNGPEATAARCIQGFQDLDGIEFLALVDVEKDGKGQDKNTIRVAVEPDNPQYAQLKQATSQAAPTAAKPASAAPVAGKPSWA